MALKLICRNLRFISSQPADTTLITSDGEHIPTQQHLLSAVSPYLASLLAQAGQGGGGGLAITLPFDSHVVRLVLHTIVSEGDEIESEGFVAARQMGIMFIKEKVSTREDDFKKEVDPVKEFIFDDNLSNFEYDSENRKDIPVIISNRLDKAPEVMVKDAKKETSDKEKNIRHKCNTCALDFKRNKHLSLHIKQVHPGIKNFCCDNCEKTFSTAGSKDTHIQTVHSMSQNKPHSCEHCGKYFSTAGNRNTHIGTMHSDNKPFSCEHCGKSFSTSGNLATHIRNIHEAGPPLPCPHCGKSFQYMDIHIKRIHAMTNERYTCEECGKTFTRKGHLSDHMKCHLPEDVKRVIKEKEMEKHQCTACGKRFINSTRLKWHEAAKHTGIKSFHCQQCPKSYFRSDHLKTHVTSNHAL